MRKQRGTSLLELLAAVAIMGIIAAIAIPSYQNYVRRAHRADAQSSVRQLANAMERYYSKNPTGMSYVGASLTTGNRVMSQWVPQDSDATTAIYELRIISATASDFVVAAVPRAGKYMEGDDCGSFVLASNGRQWNTTGAPSVSPGSEIAMCW